MKRANFKFTNGDEIHIPADYICLEDGVYRAFAGDYVVAYAKQEYVNAVYLSEQKEGAKGNDNKGKTQGVCPTVS